MSRVQITLANLGYPNGRYQEVPPKKPPNQKTLLSFFTQGVLRVLDLRKTTNFKYFYFLTLGSGDSSAFIVCNSNNKKIQLPTMEER